MTKSSNPVATSEPGQGLLPSPGLVLQVDVVVLAFGVAVMHGWVADSLALLLSINRCMLTLRSCGTKVLVIRGGLLYRGRCLHFPSSAINLPLLPAMLVD
jgi:hypothetical protein